MNMTRGLLAVALGAATLGGLATARAKGSATKLVETPAADMPPLFKGGPDPVG